MTRKLSQVAWLHLGRKEQETVWAGHCDLRQQLPSETYCIVRMSWGWFFAQMAQHQSRLQNSNHRGSRSQYFKNNSWSFWWSVWFQIFAKDLLAEHWWTWFSTPREANMKQWRSTFNTRRIFKCVEFYSHTQWCEKNKILHVILIYREGDLGTEFMPSFPEQ